MYGLQDVPAKVADRAMAVYGMLRTSRHARHNLPALARYLRLDLGSVHASVSLLESWGLVRRIPHGQSTRVRIVR
jgi:DNA-binding IclR family transcriptional regulator